MKGRSLERRERVEGRQRRHKVREDERRKSGNREGRREKTDKEEGKNEGKQLMERRGNEEIKRGKERK